MGQAGQEGKPTEPQTTPAWAQSLQVQLQRVDEHLVDLNEALLMLVAVRNVSGNEEGERTAEQPGPPSVDTTVLKSLSELLQQTLHQAQLLAERNGALLARLEQFGQRLEAAEAARRAAAVHEPQPSPPRSLSGRPTSWPSASPPSVRRSEPENKVLPIRPALTSAASGRALAPTPTPPPASSPRPPSVNRRSPDAVGRPESQRDAEQTQASTSSPRPRWRWW